MANPNHAQIDVVLTPVTPCKQWPDGIKFVLESPLLHDGKLVFRNNLRPGFNLYFNIVDAEGTGYLFPDDAKQAMWVRTVENRDERCPMSAMYWDRFEARHVKDDNKTLKIFNRNDDLQLFMFTLLFTKTPRDNGPCIAFDPIGDNRNGMTMTLNMALAVGAGVIGLAAGMFAFVRRWHD